MTRSMISLLALSCVFAVGCPGGDAMDKDVVKDDTAESGTGDCVEEDGDGFCVSDGDCDDNNPAVNPDAEEICDGNDNNCNGEIDENGETVYYEDADNDGFGDRNASVMACDPESGWVANGDDCDDDESTVYPGADEVCDGLDNDCNGIIDDEMASTYYRDADGDGYGDPGWAIDSCSDPGAGWVTTPGDFDDEDPASYTGAVEICDGIDNDGNGVVDDGLSSTWYPDADGDGYGDDAGAVDTCVDPGAGWIGVGGDCDDSEALAWTGAAEYCDDVDNDCNGLIDDDALDATAQIADDDADGFGSATASVFACDALVTNTMDCDDADAREPQVVDDSATASSADGSLTNPWTTVQEGIDTARICVAVLAGTYTESIDFGGSDIAVFSTDGWAATVLVGSSATSVVTFQSGETNGAELDGFTIQGGGGTMDSVTSITTSSSGVVSTSTVNSYFGGGILVDNAAPTLVNLYVTGNVLPAYGYTEVSTTSEMWVYSYGGGLFATNSTGMVVNAVTFEGNWADNGGGVYASDSTSFEATATRFLFNGASYGGGYATAGTLDLTNAVLQENEASYWGGGAWVDGGSSTLWNVTAVSNGSAMGGGAAVTDYGLLYLYSSVVSDSSSGEGVYGDSSAVFSAEFSDLYGNAGGGVGGSLVDPAGTSGNIASAPMYTSWDADATDDDDLNPTAGSPLLNAGNPSAAYNDTDGSVNDIGAYGGPGGGW